MHSAMYGVLGLADALVIVSAGSIDGARSASATRTGSTCTATATW